MASSEGRFQGPVPKKPRLLVKTDSIFDLDIDFLNSYEDKDDLRNLFSTAKLNDWRNGPGAQWSSQITDQDVHHYDELVKKFPLPNKSYKFLPKADVELSHFFPKFLEYNKNIINTKPKVDIKTKEGIGRGGYGAVVRGTWTVNGTSRPAAFKSTIGDETDDFDQELSMLQKLDHASVVRFLGSCIKGSKRYIAMELCDGNLDQYVQEQLVMVKNVPTDRNILGQVALGLGYLHGQEPPIIHKDLKPQNILLQKRTGLVLAKLSDFGFSRQRPANQDQFDPTDHQGTEGFIAPELLKTKIPSLESDVWAFGATVFYVISGGQHPHEVPGLGKFQNKIMRSAIVLKFKMAPNMAAISDHLPAADLTHRLLCYEPKQRPSIFLVLHHPYFSLAHNKAHEYLSKKISDFLMTKRPDGSRLFSRQMFTFDKLSKWYDDLDKSNETDDERRDNEEFIAKLREDHAEPPPSPSNNFLALIKESMKDLVNPQSEIDLLVLRRSQDLSLLRCNTLLVSFIWSTLMSLNLPGELYRDHLQMSELEFGLIHNQPEFFEEIWNVRRKQMADSEGDKLLSVAAALNLPQFVSILVKRGANPNFIDSNGYTALFHAATHEAPDLRVLKMLLEFKADPNIPDRHGTTLLRHINVIFYPDIVKLLLENGADPNCGPEGWTPLANLIRLSSSKCVPIMQLLLEHGANPSVLDHKGVPMLKLIIERGDVEMLRVLVDKGASVTYVDSQGRTLLHLAIWCEKVESVASLVRILLDEGVDPNAVDLDGQTALHYAVCKTPDIHILKILIDKGGDTELIDKQAKRPRDYVHEEQMSDELLRLLTR